MKWDEETFALLIRAQMLMGPSKEYHEGDYIVSHGNERCWTIIRNSPPRGGMCTCEPEYKEFRKALLDEVE